MLTLKYLTLVCLMSAVKSESESASTNNPFARFSQVTAKSTDVEITQNDSEIKVELESSEIQLNSSVEARFGPEDSLGDNLGLRNPDFNLGPRDPANLGPNQTLGPRDPAVLLGPDCSRNYHFDYILLTLQWPAGFCSHESCRRHADEWGIHGAWPQNNDDTYPQNCCFEKQFDIRKLAPVRAQLDKDWLSLKSSGRLGRVRLEVHALVSFLVKLHAIIPKLFSSSMGPIRDPSRVLNQYKSGPKLRPTLGPKSGPIGPKSGPNSRAQVGSEVGPKSDSFGPYSPRFPKASLSPTRCGRLE